MQRNEELKRQNRVNRFKKQANPERRKLAQTLSNLRQLGDKETAQEVRKKALEKKVGR